ncbi:MAG: hypothetical protein HC797_06995 [Anaerolineales bacterium]|nr:hypothetical protein [Anaerolineales bacterium]
MNFKEMIKPVASFLTPLLVGALLLGYYNYARFESPFEFGLRYQITIYNLNRDMHLTFQPDYFPLNMYAYGFQPFEFISKFPFIQPIGLTNLLNELNIIAPKLYAGGRVIGFLFYAPFLLLAWIPFISRNNNQFQKILYLFLERLP